MYRLSKSDDYILLIVYVDDLLYIGSNDDITTWFEGELQQDLTLTVSSTVTQYLGLNIREEEGAIYINAAKYTDTIAKRFAITPTAISTPYRYATGKDGSVLLKPAGIRNYQKKLGCLLFAAVTCRPDLSYSASQLATYLKRPETEHLAELDRALHYFVSTPMIGLTYYKNATTPTELVDYVDTDHAGDADNRRSRTGYIYRLEPIGPISWQSILPIFEGCSPPQFPTPTASAAVTQPTARAEIAAVFALYGGWGKHMGGRDRGKGGVLASSCAVVTMVGAVVDTGVVDTLDARLENARRCHKANEYGDLPCAVIEAGICAVWATEHSSRPVSPRPVNTEGGVDAGVNAGGGQVGSSAGGTLRQRGVIHADEVGGVQARGVRSSATASSSSGWKLTKDADKRKSAKDNGRGGGSQRRECWLCGDPDHHSFECPDCSDSDDDDAKGGRGRSGSRRPRRVRNQPRKEKQSTKSSTSAKDADSSAGGKGRDDEEASCSLVSVVEPTVSLAPEAGEDF
ncbi:unnamed protein product [Closterium sp. NIES-54]